ncbi:MAG TPA: hypothetical protein VGQ06_08780 [Gemmatimonadales bacterium]|jgi:hypothetical protein|nr:hypothetical protein [Gemmatimonadales bacterium]
MSSSRFIPVVALVAAVACGGSYRHVLLLDTTPRPRTHPDSVRLIAQEPQQPYTVIALLSVQSRGWPFERTPRERLLKEAARLGGEAVLLDNASITVVGGDESRQEQLTGKVIVFKRESRAANAQ